MPEKDNILSVIKGHEKEEDIFKRWLRKVKAKEKNYELDDAIEDDLKERISEPITKKK